MFNILFLTGVTCAISYGDFARYRLTPRTGRWKLYLPHTYRTMDGQPPGKDGKPGAQRPGVEDAGLRTVGAGWTTVLVARTGAADVARALGARPDAAAPAPAAGVP